MKVSLFLILSIWTMQAFGASTYYVSKAGNDSHACSTTDSAATNKLTIGGGIGCLSAGDTLYVHTGTYAERIADTIPAGSSWSAPTTISAYPGETVTIQPSSGVNVIEIDNNDSHYIVINGFHLDGSNVSEDVIALTTTGATFPDHIRISNNEIAHAAVDHMGIAHYAGYGEVLNNHIHHNGDHGSVINGIGSHGAYVAFTNSVIDGNEIDNNGYAASNSMGIQLYAAGQGVNDNIVRNNIFHDQVINYALYMASGSGNVAYNNIFYSNPYGMNMGLGCTDCAAYNNTFYNNTNAAITIGAAGTDSIVTNNISYMNGSSIDDGGTNTTCTYNLGVDGGEGSTDDCVGTISHDPKFVNAGANNFHLLSDSPAIGAGADLSAVFTTDKDGIARGAVFDIGAYEYTTSSPAPVTLITHTSAGSTDLSNVTTSAIDTSGADFLTVEVAVYGGNPMCTLTDSKSNTWTGLNTYTSGQAIKMFYAAGTPVVGSGHTFTCNGSNLAPSIAVQAWSGISPVPLDVQSGAMDANVTGIRAGSITPTTNEELIVTAASVNPLATGISIDSAFTKLDEVNYLEGAHFSLTMGYKIQSTATTENPTWTGDATLNYWVADIAAFRNSTTFAAAVTPSVFRSPVFAPRIFSSKN